MASSKWQQSIIESILHGNSFHVINSKWPISILHGCGHVMPISPQVESAPHPIILPCSLQPPLLPFTIAAANNQALLFPAAATHLPYWMRLPPMPVGVLEVNISCQEQPLHWGGRGCAQSNNNNNPCSTPSRLLSFASMGGTP